MAYYQGKKILFSPNIRLNPVGRLTEAGGEVFNDYKHNAALAPGSSASGIGTIANAEGQRVAGKYNSPDIDKVDIFGGGTPEKLKNLYTLDKFGNAEFAGYVKANGKILASEELVKNLFFEHYDHIKGDEIDTKYNTGGNIPQILLYDGADGYENAPFEHDGIIITHSCRTFDEGFEISLTYQFAISYDGQMVHRSVTDEAMANCAWSNNLIPKKLSQLDNDLNFAKKTEIPTKLSQLENDKNFANSNDIFGSQLFYDEIDTKYYPGDANIPLVMTYDARNRNDVTETYENAPFFRCVIITIHNESFYNDMETIDYTAYQIAYNGFSMKVRVASEDGTGTFEGVPWETIGPLEEFEAMYRTFIANGYDADNIVTSLQNADEALSRVADVEHQIGDIETALDNILAMQNALIGGESE